MKIDIPGRDVLEIKNIVFDYNGTIAIDGKLIEKVADLINEFSTKFNFYVITADTYGSVQKELENTNCKIIVIPQKSQDKAKLEFIQSINEKNTLSVGNGRNDTYMLKHSALGIAILQEEGLCTQTLLNSDILVKSIFDVFAYLKDEKRLIATLRN